MLLREAVRFVRDHIFACFWIAELEVDGVSNHEEVDNIFFTYFIGIREWRPVPGNVAKFFFFYFVYNVSIIIFFKIYVFKVIFDKFLY